MKKIGVNYKLLVSGILAVLLGLVFFFINTDVLLKVCFFVVGALIAINAAYNLVKAMKQDQKLDLIYSLVDLCIGILLMFFHNTVILIVVGAYFVVFPIIRIVMSDYHWEQAKLEIPMFIIALVCFLLTPAGITKILFYVIGGILVLCGVLTFASSFYVNKYLE